MPRRSMVAGVIAAAGALLFGTAARSTGRVYVFAHDRVLGTSLDLSVVAISEVDAERADTTVLAEIERVRRIISTYDTASEASHLISDGRLAHPSPELADVLAGYDEWAARSGRAYTPRVGALTSLWHAAEREGRMPARSVLASVAAASRRPAWRRDAGGAIVALGTAPLDLSSLGKGYIVERAMQAARVAVPSLRGAMVDIGGDVRVWGDAPAGTGAPWMIGVADPRHHADNARPLTTLALRDRAVSSSGGYERGFTVAGRHFSHIIDPRTGLPADGVIASTVVARDNATANALATTLSMLSPRNGLALVATVSGAEALIVTADGTELRSPGFAALERRTGAASHVPLAPGVRATMSIDVTPRSWARRRPYVAAWVADVSGHHVRTLAMWGDRYKYMRDLDKWWAIASRDQSLVDAVTRATRPAGKYTLEWDGLDQHGSPVSAGSYIFWLEVAYQNGAHSVRSATVSCGSAPATGTIDATDAFAGGRVDCSVAP